MPFCPKQNLINFVLFHFFQLGNLFYFVSCKPFFLYYSQHLSLMIFSRLSVAAVWGFPKHFSVQNNNYGSGEE